MFFQGVSAHGTLLGSKCSYGCCGLVADVQNSIFRSYSDFKGDTEASNLRGSVARATSREVKSGAAEELRILYTIQILLMWTHGSTHGSSPCGPLVMWIPARNP